MINNHNFGNTILALKTKNAENVLTKKQNSHYYIKYRNGTKRKKCRKYFGG